MAEHYQSVKITIEDASKIIEQNYDLKAEISPLPGELDFNFKISTPKAKFILKVSRSDANVEPLAFQQSLLNYLSETKNNITFPRSINDIDGNSTSLFLDSKGSSRMVRLLTWIDGRLMSSVNPQNDALLFNLGQAAGSLTNSLQSFNHKVARRELEWDLSQAKWTQDYTSLFTGDQLATIEYFQKKFNEIQPRLGSLRKAVVHNDVNDNNVLVSKDLEKPKVTGIIDFGDAIHTAIINDLAITIAYAVMNKTDVLSASRPTIKGYHEQFNLLEEELEFLYILVAMRLVTTVTKSAINKEKEPDNKYHLISEAPAWDVLTKWQNTDDKLALFSFRYACGYSAHPSEKVFSEWANSISVNLYSIFPTLKKKTVLQPDFSVGSTWVGHGDELTNDEVLGNKVSLLQGKNPQSLLAGGYLEPRLFYTTDVYRKEGNNGPEYRTQHLGIDFWVDEGIGVHCPLEGTIISAFNNDHNKDYGPTIILEHKVAGELTFYSLYGHLSKSSLEVHKEGDSINSGDLIGYIGAASENGNWLPHLHFQLMLDMLGNETDFPGVAYPNDLEIWESICPNPNVLFKEVGLNSNLKPSHEEILSYRRQHLGKSLSLSYEQPLTILRGSGAFLIDNRGRKYLDTVNNVAHVGHEHPRVVNAGSSQMAVLNTNTRYLHPNITQFAEELIKTMPEELSVVHFVNSGSEANELALRMAKAYTGQKDMIALEVGYHGNTAACIDISSYKFDGKGGSGAPEFTRIVPLPDTYRGLYQGTEASDNYAKHVQYQIDLIKDKGRKVAGFIAESIVSCGGQVELPEGYLKTAYKTVRDAGGICIADEVQVGCGRMGSVFWSFQLHDVVPDIVTIGKPIGNGHPLAAVVCKKEVAEAFANGMEYFNTFGGNPVSCAIGTEVLRVIREENLQENALQIGNYLKEQLVKLQDEFPIIGDIRGQGLFLGMELVNNAKDPLPKQTSYLANRMRDFAILMSVDGRDNNVLKIKPPMVFSKENADELLSRLSAILGEDLMRDY